MFGAGSPNRPLKQGVPPPRNANLRALQKRLDSPSFGDTSNLCLAYTYPAFVDLLAIGIVIFVHFSVNFKHGSMGDHERLDNGIAVPENRVHLRCLNLGAEAFGKCQAIAAWYFMDKQN